MNVQFAVKDRLGYLIDVNPRASRIVPFVAKAIGTPIAKIAARVMAGEPLMHFLPIRRDIPHIAVKEAVFPFARFPGIDPVLSPEMKSTGEVMGIDADFATAFLKSQQGGNVELPTGGTLFVSVKDSDKSVIVPPVRALIDFGFDVIATSGTAAYLASQGLDVTAVNKVAQGRPHIVDLIKNRTIDMIINTTEGRQSTRDSASIRRSAENGHVYYTTTLAGGEAICMALKCGEDTEVRRLQDLHKRAKL
jgi:carbamoyl-phosphate synthase large subunit